MRTQRYVPMVLLTRSASSTDRFLTFNLTVHACYAFQGGTRNDVQHPVHVDIDLFFIFIFIFFLFIIILHTIWQGYTNSRMLIRVWTLINGTYLYL